jgi:hypothetical protein
MEYTDYYVNIHSTNYTEYTDYYINIQNTNHTKYNVYIVYYYNIHNTYSTKYIDEYNNTDFDFISHWALNDNRNRQSIGKCHNTLSAKLILFEKEGKPGFSL